MPELTDVRQELVPIPILAWALEDDGWCRPVCLTGRPDGEADIFIMPDGRALDLSEYGNEFPNLGSAKVWFLDRARGSWLAAADRASRPPAVLPKS